MSAVVLTGDCRVVLGRFPENYFDAVVCDPPYELGFMGKHWDKAGVSFDPQTWKTVLRVLKPGGHLLAFGGTRTYHRIVVAIEDAGFEIRDMVTWLYGQGFPKSMNVGMAIDKAERGVPQGSTKGDPLKRGQGKLPNRTVLMMGGNDGGAVTGLTDSYGERKLSSAVSTQWEGWGTALKPAVEPIVLARKPFKGTVAANVLEHGTGALNIDGTRIGYQSETDQASAIPQGKATAKSGALAGGTQNDRTRQEFEAKNDQGRWPANLILGHHDDCEELGTKKVKAIKGGRKANITESGVYGQGKGIGATSTKGLTADDVRGDPGYGDEDGMETVASWDCHPDCPVRMLDEQTGDLPSGGSPTRKSREVGLYEDGLKERVITPYTDKGGASRFFYQAKASRKERNAGLDHLDDKPLLWSSGTQSPGTFQSEGTKKSARNNHPTVKPIALMRYLIRLVTPPGGRVLDPFTGSGTTGIAASLEGFNFVGVELDPEYAALAQTRIKHWSQNA